MIFTNKYTCNKDAYQSVDAQDGLHLCCSQTPEDRNTKCICFHCEKQYSQALNLLTFLCQWNFHNKYDTVKSG